ncbi:MAG: aldose 1-epimerase family protein [Hungatella sp.]
MLITLNNATLTAIIDTMGAQLISLKDTTGKEYIWQRDPDVWARCSPLLFPAVGNSRNDKTIIEGSSYHLPKHGFCKESDFAAKDITETKATFWIRASEFTKTMYPYDFCLSLTYTLTEQGISMDYQVDNEDSRKIYYALGAHPGFCCPLEDSESFEDYQLKFEHKETLHALIYDCEALQFDCNHRELILDQSDTLPLSYHLFDRDALYFDHLDSRKVSILNPGTGQGIEVSYPDFSSVAFWTPNGQQAPFLCIEPWNGSAIRSDEDDIFTHKHGIQTLEIGEHKTYHLGIRILPSKELK